MHLLYIGLNLTIKQPKHMLFMFKGVFDLSSSNCYLGKLNGFESSLSNKTKCTNCTGDVNKDT
jgi:hypothetical protein